MKMILTAEQMRWADKQTIEQGMSGSVLMERAGIAVANAVLRYRPDSGRIVIVAGSGNNGGDGYAAARELAEKNMSVTVIALASPDSLQGDAAKHAELAQKTGVKIRYCGDDSKLLDRWLARAVIVVDAIFGTGITRALDDRMRKVVDCINASGRAILSVDISSGIHSDTGEVMGDAVRADWTLPIAATKWGHWLGDGPDFAGHLLTTADIGISETCMHAAYAATPNGVIDANVVDEVIIKSALQPHSRSTHKTGFGHVWVFGGSKGYTGAPRLAAMGAMGVHAGLVSIACGADVYPVIAASCLEVMTHPQETAPWHSADAIVAGPGWGMDQAPLLQEILTADIPLILDADALNMLAVDDALRDMVRKRRALTVFTPHPGEAGRLLGCSATEVQSDRLGSALKLAESLQGWVLLKGAESLIVSPEPRIWLCPFGSNRLATAGTGDVLAGVIGGFLGQGIEAEEAIPAAVGVHAKAGERLDWYRAGQLPEQIAAVCDVFRCS